MGAENAASGILKTKLYAPRLPDIISRGKLLQELEAAKQAKLTTIVAGAGYGKSTLAAAFLAAQKAPSVWYQLEETDRDLSEFITYLVAGIRMEISGFGEDLLSRLQAGEGISGSGKVVLSALISEMDSCIKDDLFIVLDDFQEVNDSPQVTGALNFLLGHMLPNLHLVVLSRIKPNLELASLAAHRELVEIKEKDLSFSPEETSELFNKIFGLPLKDEDAQALVDFTEGWITGLVLFWLAVKDKGKDYAGETLKDLDVPSARVAEYLSGVVFENQSKEVKDFLMKTSILMRMNPGFCDQLLGIEESGTILKQLADSRLFTIPLDEKGDWYRYHHLLRSFLKERLSESYSQEEIKQLNLKAASLWEEQDEPEQALHNYLEAGEHEEAARVLERMAPGLLKASRISFLYDNLYRLPEEALRKHPWLVFDLAKVSDLTGEYDVAIRSYGIAASLFEERGDVENQARSLINRGWLLGWTGRPDEAADCLTRGMEILPPDSRIRRKTAATLSSEYALRGISDVSLQFQCEAMEGIDELEDEASRATVLSWCGLASFYRGDFSQCLELCSRAHELALHIGLDALLPDLYPFLSYLCALKGRLEEALDYAEKGLSPIEPFSYTEMVMAAYFNRALVFALLGEREEALKDIEMALEISKGLGDTVGVINTECMAGIVYMFYGHHEKSIEHFKKAERIAKRSKHRYYNYLVRLFIIWQSSADMDIDTASEEIGKIAETSAKPGAGSYFFPYDLVLALLEILAGREDEARGALEASLEQAADEGSVGMWGFVWSGKEAPRLLPLVADFFSRGEHLEYLGYAFSSMGKDSLPYLKELAKSRDAEVRDKAREILESITREAAEPLEIRMLGPFEVTRGGKTITSEDWRSKKALAVMKYLVAQGERQLVPRDVLMELLWPESSPQSASKSLNVALTALRKTLEPEGVKGESSYLVASGDSLRLELGGGGWVDFKLFRKKISQAEETRRSEDSDLYLERLQEAEELYRGDFLAEDLYEDWCRSERESLHGEYLNTLLDISGEYLGRGNTYAALRYTVKAIEADPGREDLYRRQMEICSRMGDRAGVERAFQRCSDYLKEEFDVDPSSETMELYRSLRGD